MKGKFLKTLGFHMTRVIYLLSIIGSKYLNIAICDVKFSVLSSKTSQIHVIFHKL